MSDIKQDEQMSTDTQSTGLVQTSKARIRLLIFFVLFFLVPLSIPAVFFLDDGLNKLDVTVDDQFGSVDSVIMGVDKKSVPVWFQAINFNPESRVAQYKIYPWPSSDLASDFESSTVLKNDAQPIRVWIDAISGENKHTFNPGDSIGAITAEFDVLSRGSENSANDARYPFDEYKLDTYAQTWMNKSKYPENDIWTDIKTFDFFYTTPVSGFQVSHKRTAIWDDPVVTSSDIFDVKSIEALRAKGLISFQSTFSRSVAVKTIAIIIGIFCVMSTITLAWITKNIWSRKRPPTIFTLVYSATTALGVVQLREILPGRPRIGIAMDFIIVFPTLLISLISSLMITSIWIKYDDWDI